MTWVSQSRLAAGNETKTMKLGFLKITSNQNQSLPLFPTSLQPILSSVGRPLAIAPPWGYKKTPIAHILQRNSHGKYPDAF